MSRCLLLLALLTTACNDDSDTDPSNDKDCGDPDGPGDVPSLLGSWTSNFGLSFLDGNCPSDQIPITTLDFLEQPFEVEGAVPSAVVMTFAKDPDLRLTGTVSPGGAWAMSGAIEKGQATLHVALGGLLYSDQSGRTHWDGAVFVGGDLNGDNIIDCDFRSDWRARKSGT